MSDEKTGEKVLKRGTNWRDLISLVTWRLVPLGRYHVFTFFTIGQSDASN